MDELCKTIESKVRAMKGIPEDDGVRQRIGDLNEKRHPMHSTPLWAHSRSSWALSPVSRCLSAVSAL